MDITGMAAGLPNRAAQQRRYLKDAGSRLTSPSAQELLLEASVLTSAVELALNESSELLKHGISQLDSDLAGATSEFDEGMAALKTATAKLSGLASEWVVYCLTTLRSTQGTLNAAYEIALRRDQVVRELFLLYYERWFEAVYCALGFFESEHQRDQLRTLLGVLIGMIPGVGTVGDLIDLSNALRPAAATPTDFRGVEQFEQYSNSCRVLLVQFESLADIAQRTAPFGDAETESFAARLTAYRVELGHRVDKRIHRVIEQVHGGTR